jgi:hypothetical protein
MELLIVLAVLGLVAYSAVARLVGKRTCPGCGRAAVVGRTHCPFCSVGYAGERRAPPDTHVPSLTALEGAWQGSLFRLRRGQLSIGRGDKNDIPLEEARVSRQHAAIVYRDGQYLLVDRDSQQGTYVNGQPVSQAVLRPGDRIQIGSSLFLFEVGFQVPPPRDQGNLPTFDQARSGIKGLTLGRKISGSAALVALFCFFLPWVKLSCGAEIVASGLDLAVAPPSGASQGPTNLLLLAAPAMALAIVVVIYTGLNAPRLELRKKASWQLIMAGLGAIPPISVFLAVHQARNDPSNFGLGYLISIEYGLWGSLAASLGVIVGALLDLKEPERHDM